MATRFILSRRTYSEPVIIPEDEYLDYLAEKIYSKKDNDYDDYDDLNLVDLNSEVTDSHRGLGRAAVVGLGAPGIAGRMAGKRHANKLVKNDPLIEDSEIRDRSNKRAALIGAAVGGGLGIPTAYGLGKVGFTAFGVPKTKQNNKRLLIGSLGAGALAAGLGAAGGAWGNNKNLSDRFAKRDKINSSLIRSRAARKRRSKSKDE